MKLTLLFIAITASLMASGSHQQQQNNRWLLAGRLPNYFLPRMFFYPPENGWMNTEEDESEIEEEDWSLIQPRNGIKNNNKILPQENRLFFGAFRPPLPSMNGGGGGIPWYGYNTFITTTTISSTILSASITTCIPVNQFATASISAGLTTCARKRRTIYSEEANNISPSIVHAVEPSEAPASILLEKKSSSSVYPALSSSKDEELNQDIRSRSMRAFMNNNRIVTVVSTVTTYIFNTTYIRKSITPAVTVGQLGCIPPGMTVC